ncbi:hypothetical protein [Nonomuraea longicatena]|uniref:Uncharacterized protein n=1 Tax=Nonomuraea longicatena TaxID=83682 RepID=A0ABP4AIM3_9ACTN
MPSGTLPLRLTACRHLLPPPGRWTASDDDRATVTRHYEEMLALYGVPVPFANLAAETRTPYGDLAAAALDPERDAADLLMVACSTPDYDARRSPTSELAGLLGDRPLPYLVCDEGTVAAFTALRLAGLHDVDRTLLLVMEQGGITPAAPVPEAAAVERDSVVVLALARSQGTAGMRTCRLTGIAPERLGDAFAVAVKEVVPGGEPYTVVLGAGLSGLEHIGAAGVVRARPGLGGTGVWAALAEHAPALRGPAGQVVLAEYEARHGFLALAALPAGELPA